MTRAQLGAPNQEISEQVLFRERESENVILRFVRKRGCCVQAGRWRVMVTLSEKKLGSWDTEVPSWIASGLGTSASVRPISDRLKPAEPPQDRRVLVSVPGLPRQG